MCARCDNGWAEYRANGDYLTGGFCGCPAGDELKKEMSEVWDEMELHDYAEHHETMFDVADISEEELEAHIPHYNHWP